MTARHELLVRPELHTLGDILRHYVVRRADSPACTELDSHGDEVATLTYAELEERVRDTAALLQQVAAPGDRAVLMLPNGIDFVVAFFACAYAGLIAVPAPAPDGIHGGRRTLGRLEGIVKDADPTVVLTTAEHAASPLLADLGAVEPVVVADVPAGLGGLWRDPGVQSGDPAFLQYTSGSTSAPKGVVLSHGNVLANLAAIAIHTGASECSADEYQVVSWLPIFHDMGLAQLLGALYNGGRVVLLPPMALLMRPFVWLDAISRFRGRVSSAPNFAFDLCVEKVSPEQRARLDLSSWRFALNGAEPVRYGTLTGFLEAFAVAGLAPDSFRPCYGLAEAVVYVTGARRPGDAACVDVDAEALEQRGEILPAAADRPSRRIVGCGRIPANLDVRVVDPETAAPLEAGRAGELWVAGDSVSAGYWRQPEATAARFSGRLAGAPDVTYLRTGDLGFVRDDQLFVLGRIDDLIIVDGRNHYPTDLELTVGTSHPAIAPNLVAAFLYGEERRHLGVVAETARQVRITRDEAAPGDGPAVRYADVVSAVRRAVAEEHQLHVDSLILLRPGALPRTTSGKVQRKRSRDLLPDGGTKAW
ncbi:fatty acyl-AMP ligase [Dactylosporangium fulvum]|uniref:Fatty acyl-AMP ligase n=1 Tax=Dactylosporangium fulvum TaxID=53359 RepID=A0ABY5VQ12_9ACTN|nr:fatty acyl-AMP ligase [Dactylosporangium fulvum]UWP79189.1 fatty acyl-AMP ligase [Dactylosporangium fulvum]